MKKIDINNIEEKSNPSIYNTFEVYDDLIKSNLSFNNDKLNSKYKIFGLISLFISLIVITYVNTSNYYSNSEYNTKYDSVNTLNSYSIEVSVQNPGYDTIRSLDLLPWDVVLEASRLQYISIPSFTIEDESIDLSSDKYDITWEINDEIYQGNNVELQIDQTGVYDCKVTITPISANMNKNTKHNTLLTSKRKIDTVLYDSIDRSTDSYELTFKMAVKYVRREIRSLNDNDLNSFFQALQTTYTLNEIDGQALYGSKYHSAEYFLKKHLNGAGRSDCDHWHDGAGIVTHHMAFTLELEQTLQSINPAISIPYWEYGMDLYLYSNWYDSPIFNSDWFGEASPITDDHSIGDGGFWQGVELPNGEQYNDWSIQDTGSLNPFYNAYGLLRTPWNHNPSSYIGRSNKTYSAYGDSSMPSCRQLLDCFESDSTAEMNQCINGNTHGPVHILIGGAWGEGNTLDDEDVTSLRSHYKPAGFKNLWRMGFTRCPDSCSVDESCSCKVPDEYIQTYGAKAILELASLDDTVSGETDEIYLKYLRGYEDAAAVGDMFTSSAPYDPTFWSVHGASERLLDYKRILVTQGDITDFDETWAYDRGDGRAIYLYGVCDWSNVKDSSDLTLPTCDMEQVCSGHFENDLLEFSNFLNNQDTYTNIEFYNFIHPWNDDLPYTYDTFDYDYCADQGMSFTSSTSTYKGYKIMK